MAAAASLRDLMRLFKLMADAQEEILRSPREDPRAPGGVFERVGGLLSELLE